MRTEPTREQVYTLIGQVLARGHYFQLEKREKGLVRCFLAASTGLSLAQITRLIRQYKTFGEIQPQSRAGRRFPERYTLADIALLADVDRVHRYLSGPATLRILQREWSVFGKTEFRTIAGLSLSHLYNLRADRAEFVAKPEARSTAKPRAQYADPGHLELFLEEGEGLWNIRALDACTQWEVWGCADSLDKGRLVPVLEAMLHQFPFQIGSVEGDSRVAPLCRLALAGVAVHFLAPSTRVEAQLKFYTAYENLYANYHRPCGFAADAGDGRRVYRAENYATPYEKLQSLPHGEKYLKPTATLARLQRVAMAYSDTEFARRRNAAALMLDRSSSRDPVASLDRSALAVAS